MRCSPNDSSDDFRVMQVVFTYIRGALSDRVIDNREDRLQRTIREGVAEMFGIIP